MNSSFRKKLAVIVIMLLAGAAGFAMYYRSGNAEAQAGGGAGGRGRGGGGFGGFGGGGLRLPMTVEVAPVSHADLSEQITIVGNLIGEATVDAAPKINGRLQSVAVKLGDRVTRGQQLARIEDSEITEQVKQSEAALEVAKATVRQREADLRFSNTNLERTQNLAERQLVSRQMLDDAESRQQAAVAQLDLARAQLAQSQARVDELKINLSDTIITSPVTGFVGKRSLDPGAWVTPNTALISVVDISTVRLVANVVERDLRRVTQGMAAGVGVDAYPGERFVGRVARVAPVLDPATRTAQIEVEIPNPQGRLKPGMYAKVEFTVEQHDNALVVPSNAVVDYNGQRGVFIPDEDNIAKFQAITTGLEQPDLIEVAGGLKEGNRVVTTGAAALRNGDQILLSGSGQAPGGRGGRQGGRVGSGGNAATGSNSGTDRRNPAPSGGNAGGRRGGGEATLGGSGNENIGGGRRGGNGTPGDQDGASEPGSQRGRGRGNRPEGQ
jgi:membrane fusion protein, multidrug efflux system